MVRLSSKAGASERHHILSAPGSVAFVVTSLALLCAPSPLLTGGFWSVFLGRREDIQGVLDQGKAGTCRAAARRQFSSYRCSALQWTVCLSPLAPTGRRSSESLSL